MTTSRCTVVIPVYGRTALTAACLDALFASPPGVGFDVVVVDDATPGEPPHPPAAHAGRVRWLRRADNGGFAAACNDGAAAGDGELLVFLNNDTLPRPGWLDALVAYAGAHPRATVVGSKLLFPDGTVQHAGVAMCRDGSPRHVYVGFPGDHPAVSRSRRFDMVTAACMLVRREAFESAGGFDTAFVNGLEDADLCLRLRDRGHEVHLCAESVLIHHETVTRDRSGPDARAGSRLFRERWGHRARAADLELYLDDGLLHAGYDAGRLRLAIDPLLGTVQADGPAGRVEELLRERTGQVLALLGELVASGSPHVAGDRATAHPTPDQHEADALEAEVAEVLERLAAAGGQTAGAYLRYRALVADVRRTVDAVVPADATIIVASRGDADLLRLGARRAWHFPRTALGAWAGGHPADDDAAIIALEELRVAGGGYFVLPDPLRWWLESYPRLAAELATVHREIACAASCSVYELAGPG